MKEELQKLLGDTYQKGYDNIPTNLLPIHENIADCRIDWPNDGTSTLVYYMVKRDENGVNINPDGNVTTKYSKCSECGKHWKSKTQYGKTTYSVVK